VLALCILTEQRTVSKRFIHHTGLEKQECYHRSDHDRNASPTSLARQQGGWNRHFNSHMSVCFHGQGTGFGAAHTIVSSRFKSNTQTGVGLPWNSCSQVLHPDLDCPVRPTAMHVGSMWHMLQASDCPEASQTLVAAATNAPVS
jgi:hypothetical protein